MPSKWWFSGWGWWGLSHSPKTEVGQSRFHCRCWNLEWNPGGHARWWKDGGHRRTSRRIRLKIQKSHTHTHTLNHTHTHTYIYIYMGVSSNGGTPKTPQNDHFWQENPWVLGSTILGNPHIYIPGTQMTLVLNGFRASFGGFQYVDISPYQNTQPVFPAFFRWRPCWSQWAVSWDHASWRFKSWGIWAWLLPWQARYVFSAGEGRWWWWWLGGGLWPSFRWGDFIHLLGGFETFILHGFGLQGWVVVSSFNVFFFKILNPSLLGEMIQFDDII